MRRLLGNRAARIYLAGQVVSLFGDSCLSLAMGIWVKTLTGSNGAAGLAFFSFAAANLFAPAAGLLVDRVRRRPLLITANAVSGGVVLVLLLVHDAGQVWLINLVMFVYGLSYAVLGPAQSALLTVILPEDLLADANAALRTAQESLRLLGPLAGAGLFAAFGAHPVVLITAASFAFPITSLLALRTHEPVPHPASEPWRHQIIAGVRHVGHTVELRQVVIAAALSATVIGFDETVIFAIVGNGLHRPAAFVGILVAIQGVGAILGGPTAAPLIRRIGERRLMGSAMLVLAAGALLQIPPYLGTVAAGVILIGVGFPWMVIGLITLVQRCSPPQLQGRAYSAATTLIVTPQTISIAVGAALIELTGYRPLLATVATISTLAAGYLLTRAHSHRTSARASSAIDEARLRRTADRNVALSIDHRTS
jgi:MFS family permease